MIEDLRAFVTVVQEKSLTRAARRLNLTQSAISRRIQQLEEVLGSPLLDRSSRPPSATLLGARIHEAAGPIVQAVDRLKRIGREDAAPSGILRLGVTHAIGDIVIADAVSRLSADYPNVDVRLRSEWSNALSDQVIAGDLDAAVILLPRGSQPSAPLQRSILATLEVVIVESAARPAFKGRVSIGNLANAGWILNPEGCGYRSQLEGAIGQDGNTLRVLVDTYGTELQLRMVASGLGIGVVPRSILASSRSASKLRIIQVHDFALHLDVHLVHLAALGNMTQAIGSLGKTIALSFPSSRVQAPAKSRKR
jgi:DNA-binding transcriptional LysR family regulator